MRLALLYLIYGVCMPNKVFLEITNVCNLACSFCHGSSRKRRFMQIEEFSTAAERVRPFAEYLYFHLMGEPLLHPKLCDFLEIAHSLGFRVIITTNGTCLKECENVLLSAEALHKVSISLHSFEANNEPCAERVGIEDYLDECFSFCEKAAECGKIAVMRLWNDGGENMLNSRITARMHAHFDGEWKKIYSGYKLRERIFLEDGARFEWPDADGECLSENHSCYGLRDQIGILCDGTVVPCCLDADGAIPLGNIFEQPLEEILASPRAAALCRAFEMRCITEPLCKSCGYASMRYGKR